MKVAEKMKILKEFSLYIETFSLLTDKAYGKITSYFGGKN